MFSRLQKEFEKRSAKVSNEKKEKKKQKVEVLQALIIRSANKKKMWIKLAFSHAYQASITTSTLTS